MNSCFISVSNRVINANLQINTERTGSQQHIFESVPYPTLPTPTLPYSTLTTFYSYDFIPVCAECQDFKVWECSIHGPLRPVEDNSPTITDSSVSRARASLPSGLEIRKSTIQKAGLGVFAKEVFLVGLRFGPYLGKKMDQSNFDPNGDTSYMWEVGNSVLSVHSFSTTSVTT